MAPFVTYPVPPEASVDLGDAGSYQQEAGTCRPDDVESCQPHRGTKVIALGVEPPPAYLKGERGGVGGRR